MTGFSKLYHVHVQCKLYHVHALLVFGLGEQCISQTHTHTHTHTHTQQGKWDLSLCPINLCFFLLPPSFTSYLPLLFQQLLNIYYVPGTILCTRLQKLRSVVSAFILLTVGFCCKSSNSGS